MNWFKKIWNRLRGRRTFVGIDWGADGSSCTVKGYMRDGRYHVTKVTHNPPSEGPTTEATKEQDAK